MTEANNRLYRMIGEQLKDRISNKEYAIGGKLPPERTICQELGVSRTVVREAIIMLEIEGIVSVRKGSGIHILSDQPKAMEREPEPLDSILSRISSDLKSTGPFELLEARQNYECMIAELAAINATEQDMEELKKIQQHALAEDRYRDSKWDKEFHLALARSASNSVLAMLEEILWHDRTANPLWQNLHTHIDIKDLNSWHQEHQLILDAIEAHAPKRAYNAMWNHIESTKNTLYKASSALE
ncbi:putative L-lactate dehydrogenase operon regulatory protein [Pseudovibrio sp. Ad46]|uniref:GntR family transcriptional regulator n=1 Tax=unclassified Pseudovibrio TaxID=2627060 RepID=UPI0007AE7716|nr:MULTISPECIES: GntR family transcriptional regulator [unclassified Pseudovibrio]KZK88579.1 putative L-lactate dehydrogenase operon regulatory protein [Pseudovibrio sp. Ad46]KZK91199.1 putative L-lactate dehydrogenase operon regulatory protein [Pseudovibrio sp. Ad5]